MISKIGILLAVMLMALLPVCSAHAQPATALADVGRQAEAGDTLRVRHMDGRQTTGDLRVVNADSLVLEVDGQLETIPVADIGEVGTTTDSLKNGALIGLATGAVLGMFLGASSGSGDTLVDAYAAGYGALFGIVGGAAAGVGIGIGIDALVRKYDVLYQAPNQPSPTTTMTHAGYGLALRVSW